MLEHFNTLHQYAAATLTHWAICGVAGGLTVYSHYRGGPTMRLVATVIALWWIAYETTEFARIRDNVDVDLANGLFAYIVATAGCWLVHYLHVRWRKHR